MGSGSSKSRRRAVQICSRQPLDPAEVTISDRGTMVICEQKNRDNDKESAEKRNTAAAARTGNSRHTADDPDLQLLDDILAESEDCLSWPASTSLKQRMTSSPHANSNPGSTLPVQQTAVSKTLPTVANKALSTACEDLQHRPQTLMDPYSTTEGPVARGVLDIENNNLPKFSDACLDSAELPSAIMYDDVEEALMSSIEQEYI
ncbi:uncharacterized protein [Hyperolius riggenbachi]|uniref:uncharacterized protein n=1 Tax=Hyperolius riggenbachi TaxID=752182 RepID=UPI0035A28154